MRYVLIARGKSVEWVKLRELDGYEFSVSYETALRKRDERTHSWRIHRTRSLTG